MDSSPRELGSSGVFVGPLGLGCWPLAGMTREGITHSMAVATVAAAIDAGITHIDTAYCYGADGESERAIFAALVGYRRELMTIAGKCGIHWGPGRKQCVDGRPERIHQEVEESLIRLGTDHLDLLYLHAPDPAVPIEETAGALAELLKEGKTRGVGASNCSLDLLARFAVICPLSACQMHFNMLQREIEAEILPWCRTRGVAMIVYWPLMKGLLAGGMTRDQVFPTTDSRHKYPMFNGEEFQRNLDVVDSLKMVAARLSCQVADVVLAWTAEQPGITSVLFGATSPAQARANAQALHCVLDNEARQTIAAAVQARGPVAGRRAV